jgi:hypothetical protein
MNVVIDAREEIEELVAHAGRGPGTDAERRAAIHLQARLGELGRDAEVEPTWIRPNWPLAFTAYALLGVLASVISTSTGTAAAIVAGVALIGALADLSGRVHVGRRLTGRRGSQNVVSREDAGRAGTLVLVAHYDAPHSGFAFGAAPRLGRRVGAFRPVVLSLALIVATSVLRATGLDPLGVVIVQFAATITLILSLPLLVDIGLSGVVPGASDNASGVATVLRLAERYGDDLDHFDLWVLFTGGEEALGEGMREWMGRHRRELDPTSTIFLNVDTVGDGTVRYARREGPLLAARPHPRLLALCEQIAEEDAEEGRYGVRPVAIKATNDAVAARRRGFPAVTVTCRGPGDAAANLHRHTDTPDRIDDDALDRAFGFCSELIELIDEEIGPDLDERDPSREPFRSA